MDTRYELGGCTVCGATAATEVAGGEELREELEQLWAFHTRRLHGGTPPERLQDRVAFSQDPPLRIARCTGCGLLYRNPRERADQLVDTYAAEPAAHDALAALLENQRRSYAAQARRLTRIFQGTGRGLEVGSYVGGFLAAARDHGWRFSGIDVNAGTAAFACDQGLHTATGTIDESDPHAAWDVVAFWNCFDQLPDPRAALRAARRRLRDGGLVTIRVPNGAFYERWRRLLRSPARALARAALAHNNLLGFPYRLGFTTHCLDRLLQEERFLIVNVTGDVLVPIADEWTRRWAAAEERLVKALLRTAPAAASPWIEVYARTA